MNRIRNLTATLALIASITAGFTLFTSCGPRPVTVVADPTECTVEPGNPVTLNKGVTLCGESPALVLVGPSDEVGCPDGQHYDDDAGQCVNDATIEPYEGNFYRFDNLVTCGSYDFSVCDEYGECVRLTTTPENLTDPTYQAELPGGCDIGEDDDTTGETDIDGDPVDTGPCFPFDSTKPIEQCVYSQPDTLAIGDRVACCCMLPGYDAVGTFFLSIDGKLTAYSCE